MELTSNLLSWLKSKTYLKPKIDGIEEKADRNADDINSLNNAMDECVEELQTKANKNIATSSYDGLMSANDKSKIDGIELEANKTIVDNSLNYDSYNPISNKTVKSALDTKSDINHFHDERYYTESEVDAKINALQNLLDNLVGFSASVVESLPSVGQEGIIYLVLSDNGIETDIYNEYIYVSENHNFEKIGNTAIEVDLSGYATISFVNSSLQEYVKSTTLIDNHYTKSEIDVKLSNKSNTDHNHNINDISLLQSELDEKAGLNVASSSNDGLMSKSDKSKLDGIDLNANNIIVDSVLSSTSTNPLENQAVNSALNSKANNADVYSKTVINNIFSLSLPFKVQYKCDLSNSKFYIRYVPLNGSDVDSEYEIRCYTSTTNENSWIGINRTISLEEKEYSFTGFSFYNIEVVGANINSVRFGLSFNSNIDEWKDADIRINNVLIKNLPVRAVLDDDTEINYNLLRL